MTIRARHLPIRWLVVALLLTACGPGLLLLPTPAVAAPGATEFSAGISPGSQPTGITAGPDGNLWFTEPSGDRVGRITPAGVVTEFSAGITPDSYPNGITAGPDGNLWFTESVPARVGRITPAGVVTEFSAGITPGSYPTGITAGPDGNLWFTESIGDRVGRITPTGVVTEFSVAERSYPKGITAGPDGNVWFTEFSGDRVGRITPAGVVTEFSAGIGVGSQPNGITAGPDGNLWFTEARGDRVGRITPAGVVTEFSPGISAGSYPQGITAGPDGNLWFTEKRGDRVGRITPAGVVSEFSSGITAGGAPDGITAGPDGNLWFTEPSGNRVGRIADLPPTAVTGAATQVSQSSATLEGSVNARSVPTQVRFQYGRTAAYGSSSASQSAGASSTPVEVSAALDGLAAGTVYHYRLVASNASGTSYGADATFATPSPGTNATPETGDSRAERRRARARYRRALAAQARRKRGLRACYANVARHAGREQRQLSRGSSPRRNARAKRHLRQHRNRGRRACFRRHGRTPGRVTQLSARAVTTTKIVLSFRAAGTAGRRSPAARQYVVKQSRRPIRGRRGFRRAQTLCGGRCSFDVKLVGDTIELSINDLRPGTMYFYTVAARDNVSGRLGRRSPTAKARTRTQTSPAAPARNPQTPRDANPPGRHSRN